MGRDGEFTFWDNEAYGSRDASTQTFLGKPTRFCSFMRVFAVAVPPGEDDVGGGGQIAVQCRCTRFSRPRKKDGGTGDGTVMASPYAATALRLAGSELAGAAYDLQYHLHLPALWASLVVAPGPAVDVPERANRIFVVLDAGILQAEQGTPELIACLRSELAVVASKVDKLRPPTWTKKLLPAPVCRDVPAGESAKPADKEEECAICREVLEPRHGRLAAWPRCSHVFHAKCLEHLLVTTWCWQHHCPMCRSTLSIESMFD
ncbi:hypothetical protein BS78_K238800 [Paspalum vaginatum]|uniref:RING-type domain-containing protein n=1 Tax=Paspalum vaginatum TaxID=158149 RepID=A0A9W7XD96_9POAL|nr:hypothetical protein BS78_K238800 [Paspalum vaginatum]